MSVEKTLREVLLDRFLAVRDDELEIPDAVDQTVVSLTVAFATKKDLTKHHEMMREVRKSHALNAVTTLGNYVNDKRRSAFDVHYLNESLKNITDLINSI
jgi:hypothetical protein